MKRFALVLSFIIMCAASAFAGEKVVYKVDVEGFPLDQGTSAPQVFEKHQASLVTLRDSLYANPAKRKVKIRSFADGVRYSKNHDAKNFSISGSRYDEAYDFLISLRVDSAMILPATPLTDRRKGPNFRKVIIEVIEYDFVTSDDLDRLRNELKENDAEPIVYKYYDYRYDTTFSDNFGFTVGTGGSSSRYGGLPVVTVGLDWKDCLQLEVQGGVAFTTRDFRWNNRTLTNRNVLYTLALNVFPWKNSLLGLSLGAQGEEDISQELQKYTRRSWEFLLGPRVRIPLMFLSRSDEPPRLELSAYWTPGNERRAGLTDASWDNNQFRFCATVSKRFGIGGVR